MSDMTIFAIKLYQGDPFFGNRTPEMLLIVA